MDRRTSSQNNNLPVNQKMSATCQMCKFIDQNPKFYGPCYWHPQKFNIKKKHHEGNGKPKGVFAGTLTMGTTTPENEETMVVAIKKIMNQQTCPVKKYKWYVEYTERGLPHVHFMYETYEGGRIHAKVFMRYWKLWDEKDRKGKGFTGGYHKEVLSEVAYDEYISKDGGRSGGSADE